MNPKTDAVNLLESISPTLTAKNINYLKVVSGFCIIFFAGFFTFPNIFYLFNHICYFIQNGFKLFIFRYTIEKVRHAELNRHSEFISEFHEILNRVQHAGLLNEPLKQVQGDEDSLPVYTILIPLYKEACKLESLIKALNDLDYPPHKLDIKLIVEEDDEETNQALAVMNLPFQYSVVIIPYYLPRTKPKALNYAGFFAVGEYLTIYDAEDRPDPGQLRKAIDYFKTLPADYVCLQANIAFYNAEENLLTKFSGMEYRIWYEYLLKGLRLLDMPIPLGGTSNHFKMEYLRQVGGWDAYNVTEDADLGLRLFLNGYKVAMLDSYTLEEAPLTIGNWLGQRARWIKGFIQTLYVFGRQPKPADIKRLPIIAIYIFMAFSTYGYICLPWLFFAFLYSNTFLQYLWLINFFFTFAYLYSTAFHLLIREKGKIKKFRLRDYRALLLWPFYFILHVLAAYRAVWELLLKPFEWNKTQHGVSKMDTCHAEQVFSISRDSETSSQ